MTVGWLVGSLFTEPCMGALIRHGATCGPAEGLDNSGWAQRALWRGLMVWPKRAHWQLWGERGQKVLSDPLKVLPKPLGR